MEEETETAMDVEEEEKPIPMPTPTIVEAAEAEVKVPVKILKHQYYRLKEGGLACWWVQLQYSDGTKTNGVIDSTPLAESKAGRDVLNE